MLSALYTSFYDIITKLTLMVYEHISLYFCSIWCVLDYQGQVYFLYLLLFL